MLLDTPLEYPIRSAPPEGRRLASEN